MGHSNNLFDGIKHSERFKRVLFLLLAFCILAASLAIFVMSVGKPFMGMDLSLENQVWTVTNIDTNGMASQSGIKEGDRPLKVNNQPAQIFLENYIDPGIVYGMLINQLTVVNSIGQIISVDLKDSPTFRPALIVQTSMFFVCLIFWITGFYVFFKRPKNLAALLFCLCGLIFGLILTSNMAAQRGMPIAVFLEIVATVISPWLLLHFFLVLPEERYWLQRNPLSYLIYLPAVITLILFPLIGYSGGQPLPVFRTVRFFEYGAGFLGAPGVAIFNYFHAASARTRQQMKIVLISCLAALLPFVIIYLLPQAIWNRNVISPGFGILFIGFIPVGMAYAVVTQKLMDIDVIIRRGVVYGLITVVMAIILSAAIFPVMAIQHTVGTPEQIILALALGGIATALFGPTKKGVEFLVDKLFYKDRYDYRQIIQSLSNSLTSLKDYSDISRLLVGITVQSLNLAGSCLFVKAQSGHFEISAAQGTFTDGNTQSRLLLLLYHRDNKIEFPNLASAVNSEVAFLIPLVAGQKEVGILCLSPKLSRQDFSPDDIFLLQGLVSVAAAALRSAMLVHDVSLRDTFVSIASHELRSPLTSIIGFAELLKKRDLPDNERTRWVNHIQENAQAITNMADDLLNVTRIQSGRVGMKVEEVNIASVLEERLALVKESTDKHKFMIDIKPALPKALVDREKFGQVVWNLLTNAIKYSPRGGRITLAAHSDVAKHHIIISVSDEGMGIGPEDRESLFTTFHRIQRPETAGIRGIGLGLYIAKEWTEEMGGEIRLESELNKGSTFFISVPAQFSEGASEKA